MKGAKFCYTKERSKRIVFTGQKERASCIHPLNKYALSSNREPARCSMPLSIHCELPLITRGKLPHPNILLQHGCGCAQVYICNTGTPNNQNWVIYPTPQKPGNKSSYTARSCSSKASFKTNKQTNKDTVYKDHKLSN